MDVLMPQLGETVSEGTIAAWHKQAGDAIAKGDMLLDVETDKVATEITAPAAGVLHSILVAEGETVDVGTVLAIIAVDGEVIEDATLNEGDKVETSVASTPAHSGMPEKSAGDRLSPAVRRLLSKNSLNAADVSGTGRDGRLTRADVQNFIDSQRAGSNVQEGASERIPFDRIRRMTSEHMVRSKAISPHVLQTIDVDFSAVDAMRLAQRNAWRADKGYSLTYLAFVAKSICMAIREFPRVNASVDTDSLLVHADIHLAIAVDLDFKGLVAPVLRNAGSLSVSELAVAFNALGTKAKNGDLNADDLQGGTYTLSNPGPFGTLFTAPIINQPQVGILSMDAVKKRPAVVESDAGDSIEIRPVGVLAHSFDHRAIDGAYSAAYLSTLKKIIEQTDWSAEF